MPEPSLLGEGSLEIPAGLRLVSAYGERRVVRPPARLRAYGVPPGGPFDRLAAALANALVGLPDDSTALEIALGPVVFEAIAPIAVAVGGGPDGAFPLERGERIEIRPREARAYVATANPLSTPGERGPRHLADPPERGDAPLRVVAGPEAPLLDLEAFLASTYRVGIASNRVGVRLEGDAQPHALDLPSEPAIPGVVQIPPEGRPIVLGPDGPTIGGYPKIAVVIDADLDRVGRLRPGDSVRFERVTFDEARTAARRARDDRLRRTAELRLAFWSVCSASHPGSTLCSPCSLW